MKKILFLLLITITFSTYFCETVHAMEESEKFDKKTNFKWLERGIIAGMGMPKTRSEISELIKRNIGLIVTLTTDTFIPDSCGVEGLYFTQGPLSKELTAGLAIETLYLPIEPNQPPTSKQVQEFLAAFEQTQKRGKAVVVHCEYGEGRTKTMLACWLIAKKNFSTEQALKEIGYQRHKNLSDDQLNFLYRYENSLKDPSITIEPEGTDDGTEANTELPQVPFRQATEVDLLLSMLQLDNS